MEQVFIQRSADLADELAFERKLYIIRKRSHSAIRPTGVDPYWYATSLSCRTIVYKGMLTPEQVGLYFPDLADADMESALALVHSRFSTNTFPSWERPTPTATSPTTAKSTPCAATSTGCTPASPCLSRTCSATLQRAKPLINKDGSDSGIFDNTLELMTLSGRSLPHAMMMMIPEPWTGHESMSEEKKAFYEYHACLMEPWDGPASIAFTDGTMMGAVLDRNGLRPSRYTVTKDDLVIMASEAGVLPIEPENVAYKGRLEPGRMFLVNMDEGRIVSDEEIKQEIATAQPYREWLDQISGGAGRSAGPGSGDARGYRDQGNPPPHPRTHAPGTSSPSAKKPSATPSKNSACCSSPWPKTAWKPSVPWERIRPCRCCPISRDCCTTTSISCLPR
jgi:glutamate synthase (ferredoxin)